MTPGADSLVAVWRNEHDWAARYGITAHVTVRAPFLEPADWPTTTDAELESLLPVPVTLSRLEDRPGALVVMAEPDEELRILTAAISRLWPSLRPHKEQFERPLYHITVARTPDQTVRRKAAEAIASHLPALVSGVELWAASGSPATGLVHQVLAAARRVGCANVLMPGVPGDVDSDEESPRDRGSGRADSKGRRSSPEP